MKSPPKNGAHVAWNTPQGETDGEVVKTVTLTASVKGHVAKASKADPQVLVKSAKSGKTALHKPGSLKKV